MKRFSFNPLLLVSVSLALLAWVVEAVQTEEVKVGTEAPQLKWFVFREDCFDIFFNKHDFTNVECIKLTISKCIGYAIVAFSAILKVPQILKILKNGSVEGISKFLFYIEVNNDDFDIFRYLCIFTRPPTACTPRSHSVFTATT